MEKKKKNDELVSLNDELYDDFFVQELETRLETDPLVMGGLLDMVNQQEVTPNGCFCVHINVECGNLCSPVI